MYAKVKIDNVVYNPVLTLLIVNYYLLCIIYNTVVFVILWIRVMLENLMHGYFLHVCHNMVNR